MTYPLLAIVGIIVSTLLWSLVIRRRPEGSDSRVPLIYLCALIGAVVGAKALYVAAEGWLDLRDPSLAWHDIFRRWLVGKTILGALFGGYAAVEIAKKLLGYDKATGDLFALVVPVGLMLGRVGCFIQGCCLGRVCEPAWYALRDAQGVPRWPAVPLEFGFNALFLIFAGVAWSKRAFAHQLFHVYLMAYGIFRFAHEFERDTPRFWGLVSGYQIAALAVFTLGWIRYRQRARLSSLGNA